jgi:hypothetical protein
VNKISFTTGRKIHTDCFFEKPCSNYFCKKDQRNFPVIPEGETIVFKSNLGNIDSFKIHFDDFKETPGSA